MSSSSGGEGDGDFCNFQKTFDSLSDAVEWSKLFPTSFIASFEVSLSGSRKYIVTTITRFWTFYQPLKKKNHYEIIRPDTKVKMFMDLEFYTSENPTKDGVNMTKLVIENTNRMLEEKFNYKNSLSDCLVLDSSRQSKFSIHLIFKRVIFQDIEAVKQFVNIIMQNLSDKDRESLKVSRKNKVVSFIDTSVYGTFQNFRMFLSEKLGSSVPLKVAHFDLSTRQQQYEEKVEDKKEFDIFSASILTAYIEENLPTFSVSTEEAVQVQNVRNQSNIGGSAYRGGSCSPFPEVETHIMNVIQPGCYIVSWKYFKSTDTYGYIVEGNRYCRILGGSHKTQRIIFIFSLKSFSIVQSCFSDNCKSSLSDPYYLPEDLFKWLGDMEDWTEE